MTNVELLEALKIYCEFGVGGKWCYKYQPKGKDIITVSHKEKETAAKNMYKELKKVCPNI